jgi:hypothetical protein
MKRTADLHAASTELGLFYLPKSTNRSRLTALSIHRCAGRLFNRAKTHLTNRSGCIGGDLALRQARGREYILY